MQVYSFQGITPVVHRSAYVHPTASLIGNVIIGPGVYVAPYVSLRGDFGRLVIEEGANIQDHCTMHGFPDRDTVIERDGHVGHHAVIHGAIVRRNALVGIAATLLDYCEVGANSIVAAMALVKANEIIPPRTLWAGIPAKKMRDLTDADIEWKISGTRDYQRLAEVSHATLRPADPLRAVEPNRKRTDVCQTVPKHMTKG